MTHPYVPLDEASNTLFSSFLELLIQSGQIALEKNTKKNKKEKRFDATRSLTCDFYVKGECRAKADRSSQLVFAFFFFKIATIINQLRIFFLIYTL